jgi:hypothetical protein
MNDPNAKVSVLDQVSNKCNNSESCSFAFKDFKCQPTGMFGDPIPGHHVILSVTYVCRSNTQSKGKTRIVFNGVGDSGLTWARCP